MMLDIDCHNISLGAVIGPNKANHPSLFSPTSKLIYPLPVYISLIRGIDIRISHLTANTNS